MVRGDSAARLALRHYSFVDVAPLLASAGYRVIVPYLRGYGSTSFLLSATMRNGQQSVVALDIMALMDALRIQKAIVAGFDWGARTAAIMAVLWPERCVAPGGHDPAARAHRPGRDSVRLGE